MSCTNCYSFYIPLPPHLDLSPSRSSHASWEPGGTIRDHVKIRRWLGANTSRGTRGDNGTVQASLSDNVDLDGRVATRIVDGTRVDFGDGHGDESGK